jgi:perosamine synthetase
MTAVRKMMAWLGNTVWRRRLALLGGTTSWEDCRVARNLLWHRQTMIEGSAIAEYESAFAQRLGVRHALSFSSGRVGLYGLLKVLGVGPDDEVLLQVPTHIVVPNAIRYLGALPVYVDCSLDDYNMDLDQARKKITPRTKALILQHTFGIPADIEAALHLSRQFGLALIEDCVHALGARYDGKPVGSFGHAAFFSTEETKTISTTMGGMVVTDDPELAQKMRGFQESCASPPMGLTYRYVLKLIVYHLLMEPHVHRYARALYEFLGKRNPLPQATLTEELLGRRPARYEQRFSNAQAKLGLRQLAMLDSNLAHRRSIAKIYEARLAELGCKIPRPAERVEPAYVRYPFWVADREAAVKAFAPHVVLGTWFTSVLEEAVSPAHGEYEMASCPNAELAAKHLVNLPTHLRVTANDVQHFVAALQKLMTSKRSNWHAAKRMEPREVDYADVLAES